jgi:hypothetical protein
MDENSDLVADMVFWLGGGINSQLLNTYVVNDVGYNEIRGLLQNQHPIG